MRNWLLARYFLWRIRRDNRAMLRLAEQLAKR
jgi:hypothetical protein